MIKPMCWFGQELVANERQTFTEDTQADLYNQAQSTKTAGKKGLGRVAGSGAALYTFDQPPSI